MKFNKSTLFTLSFIFAFLHCVAQKNYILNSPNGKNSIKIIVKNNCDLIYNLKSNNKILLSESNLGFLLNNNEKIPSANWMVSTTKKRSVNSTWKPVWGKRSIVNDVFNELTFCLTSTSSSIKSLNIIFRAYNNGLAFRYSFPEGEYKDVSVNKELTTFNFAGDYIAWYYNGEYNNIGPERLTESDSLRKPVMTVKVSDNQYMAIHEADLRNGDPLLLVSKAGSTNFNIASKPGIHGLLIHGYNSAWRVIMLGSTPGDLVDSHLIELLNPDPDPKYDFSWVKPGIALWDWRINGAIWGDYTYKMDYLSWIKMVDFASENKLNYLVLDANWYGPEFEKDSDPIEGKKAKDVHNIIKYANEKNIGIWLYLNDVAGRRFPIEQTLKQYSKWGAVGIKYGFMNGSMEDKNTWTQQITEICAKNKLYVDFHDNPVHPYGQMRTWPNALTREYCQSQLDAHRVFEPKTFVTSVFINMLAGPIDMNNGMFDLRHGNTTRVDNNQQVPSTVVSEAARTLIVFSGVTILPDIPEFYKKYPTLLRFIAAQKMPWVESKTFDGKIGEYIVMMRQTKDVILIAAATNEKKRCIEIPMSFLGKGKYHAEISQDDENGHYLTNRETIKISNLILSSKDKLHLRLAAGGGACVLIKK